MNKELTPLEALITIVEECKKQLIKENGYMKPTNNSEYKDDMVCGYPIQKIINSLKALEIIKNKKVNVHSWYYNDCNKIPYEIYKQSIMTKTISNELLSQEEYELLKEVIL